MYDQTDEQKYRDFWRTYYSSRGECQSLDLIQLYVNLYIYYVGQT